MGYNGNHHDDMIIYGDGPCYGSPLVYRGSMGRIHAETSNFKGIFDRIQPRKW
jgi:hypothetical protein